MHVKKIKNFSSEKLKHLYPIKASDFFNRTKSLSYNFKAMKLIIDSNLKFPKNYNNLNILDWGCGNSLWPFGLFKGAFITGVDISKKNILYSKLNSEKNGFTSKYQGMLVELALKKLNDNSFDHAISFGLVELLDDDAFRFFFSKIFKLLKPGGKLFITHHNYRPISAAYLPWFVRGGYNTYVRKTGVNIQKKSTSEVISDFTNIGYSLVEFGGYCPYPSKLWHLVFSSKGWLLRNNYLCEWYYSRYIVLQKPFK
jgi:2-polyprenyl-3-methyl-5-hydroxy-6-metoxy-1,4-benzoquinol methylase